MLYAITIMVVLTAVASCSGNRTEAVPFASAMRSRFGVARESYHQLFASTKILAFTQWNRDKGNKSMIIIGLPVRLHAYFTLYEASRRSGETTKG